MKCRQGISTRTYCLKCHMPGIITAYKSPMVSMQCPKCKVEWRTLSAICERCRLPSGDPYPGECPACKRREVAAI